MMGKGITMWLLHLMLFFCVLFGISLVIGGASAQTVVCKGCGLNMSRRGYSLHKNAFPGLTCRLSMISKSRVHHWLQSGQQSPVSPPVCDLVYELPPSPVPAQHLQPCQIQMLTVMMAALPRPCIPRISASQNWGTTPPT